METVSDPYELWVVSVGGQGTGAVAIPGLSLTNSPSHFPSWVNFAKTDIKLVLFVIQLNLGISVRVSDFQKELKIAKICELFPICFICWKCDDTDPGQPGPLFVTGVFSVDMVSVLLPDLTRITLSQTDQDSEQRVGLAWEAQNALENLTVVSSTARVFCYIFLDSWLRRLGRGDLWGIKTAGYPGDHSPGHHHDHHQELNNNLDRRRHRSSSQMIQES